MMREEKRLAETTQENPAEQKDVLKKKRGRPPKKITPVDAEQRVFRPKRRVFVEGADVDSLWKRSDA